MQPTQLSIPLKITQLVQYLPRVTPRSLLRIIFSVLFSTSLLLILNFSLFKLITYSFSDESGLLVIIVSYLISCVGVILFLLVNEILIRKVSIKLSQHIITKVYKTILDSPLHLLQSQPSGTLSQIIFNYEKSISTILPMILTFITTFLSLVIMLVLTLILYPAITLVCIVITTQFFIIKYFILLHCMRLTHLIQYNYGKLTTYIVEIFSQFEKVRSSNADDKIYSGWIERILGLKKVQRELTKWEIRGLVTQLIIPIILYLFFYVSLYINPDFLDKAYLVPLFYFIAHFSGLLEKLHVEFTSIIYLLPGIHAAEVFIHSDTEKCGQERLNNYDGSIQLRRVTYINPETRMPILSDVSLTINPGEFVGIIGPSGCGKSTLFRLLLGFLTPDSGAIYFHHCHTNSLDMRHFRRQLGVVLQPSTLMPGTILSNLAINAELSIDAAWKLLESVGFAEEVKAIPMGLYTQISDNASESLSGGQIQKILIARALSTQPKVLLLDEATSALDNDSQKIIYSTLASMKVTRVIIAHRYTTIQDADSVYHLNEGSLQRIK